MEIVSETMASVGDFGASLASLVADGAAGAVDQVVALLSPDSVLQLVLIILGLALLVYLVLCLVYHSVRGLYTFTLPWLVSLVSTPNLKDKYGAWAVVTGSTQGIGREYALALAKYGLNIVLISRNKQELENVANEIRDNHKVDTATIVAEFTDADSIGKIVKKVKALNHEIGVVVNNVGMMGPGYNNMADMEKKAVKDILTVNILPLTMFCHAFIPDMAKRGKGAIVNISSVAGLVPIPYLAVYSATQHYISAFTQAIAQEYAGSGVVIQEVDPGQVDSVTSKCKFSSSTLLAPSPAKFVNSAIKTLGYNNRTCGYWSHSLSMFALQSLMPSLVSSLIVWLCSRRQYKLAHPPPPPPAAPATPPPAAQQTKTEKSAPKENNFDILKSFSPSKDKDTNKDKDNNNAVQEKK